MTALPKIRSHNVTDKGFTTYFSDEHDHRLEATYETVNGIKTPRKFQLYRANRVVAYFRVTRFNMGIEFDQIEILRTNRLEYTAERIKPFLASIIRLIERVDYTPLLSASQTD